MSSVPTWFDINKWYNSRQLQIKVLLTNVIHDFLFSLSHIFIPFITTVPLSRGSRQARLGHQRHSNLLKFEVCLTYLFFPGFMIVGTLFAESFIRQMVWTDIDSNQRWNKHKMYNGAFTCVYWLACSKETDTKVKISRHLGVESINNHWIPKNKQRASNGKTFSWTSPWHVMWSIRDDVIMFMRQSRFTIRTVHLLTEFCSCESVNLY